MTGFLWLFPRAGDARTANDSYNFLLGFLERHPNHANDKFWVAGESYGGHYVPTLSQAIVLGNQEVAVQPLPVFRIALHGVVVGFVIRPPRRVV
jgi:serine carboxypeptidase-like clade II